MRAEIIAVGTELLLGDVVNSNAAWLSRELADTGIDVYYHSTVGDNPRRIQEVIAQALSRADILIFTGGLGPTPDDLTVATIADYFQTGLVIDPESQETIKRYFIARGMPMSDTNLKQALKPQGAITIKNPIGTAPGIAWDVSDQAGKPAIILTFPGVPKELYAMWPQGLEILLDKYRIGSGEPKRLCTEVLHFFGIGESKLAELLDDLMRQASPSVAPYVGKAEVRIRVAVKAGSEEEAQAQIEPVRKEIMKRAGLWCFGTNETTLEKNVGEMLLQKGLSVSVAESCTGGLVSSRLTDVPGSSAYVFLNMVTYHNMHKSNFLDVSPEALQKFGAVSPQVAAQMAKGIQQTSGCNVGLSTTGIAGPDGGSEDKPVGLCYIGLYGLTGDQSIVKKVQVNRNYDRTDIKHWFSQYALHYLRMYLLGELESDFPEL